MPTDQNLYLICDVIGRAGEVEILEVEVPGVPAAPAAPAAPQEFNPFWEIMQRRPPMYR